MPALSEIRITIKFVRAANAMLHQLYLQISISLTCCAGQCCAEEQRQLCKMHISISSQVAVGVYTGSTCEMKSQENKKQISDTDSTAT
jgi:hypothetical protein